jgi:putative Ca2+/H+ antiporter (TMEM165/GDT1 family)
MEGLVPFAGALGLIVVLELGDKTQLATISLAARNPWPSVFLGAASGLILVTAVGAGVGLLLAEFLRDWIVAIQVGGGLIFIVFGAWTFLHERPEEPDLARDSKGAFVTAFTMNALAELGDKTQLAVIILAASTAAPLSVFAGASLALTAVAGASVAIGTALARILRADRVRLASTILFIAAGVFLIVEALLSG